MILDIQYRDSNGNITNGSLTMSRLAFLKHMAIAGQHYQPKLSKLKKMIGYFFVFSDFLNNDDFQQNKFSSPNMQIYDPTQKSFFSNLAGKSIADYIAKEYYDTRFTLSYESVLQGYGYPIQGSRPDLYCVSNNRLADFSIECKGYSRRFVGPRTMNRIKNQANAGLVPVAFTIASVSHNMYDDIKVKYYDPIADYSNYDPT
ncbi:MAG: hypothetical protein NWF07_01895, partial [Candidatus Bathyarchaeota archaeon]|nr:hypothetical protein [Candidatus Bathyarchaeota archaeon]